MTLKLDRALHLGVDVVRMGGEVDLYTAPDLKTTIYEILDSGTNSIILDMTGLEFMDSSGLGVLVGTLKRVRSSGGSLCLICDRDNLLKVFSLTGLDKVFTIHANLEECQANG